jgi:monoamine oxidase
MGIQFSERWWEAEVKEKPWLGHKGGLSTTDRPSRTIVYPSYGCDEPETGATMIASYSWAQDAARLGALARGPGSQAEKHLKNLIIEDLALVHDIPAADLHKLVVDYKVVDWYDEPNASGEPSHHHLAAYVRLTTPGLGAFAFFGPGQFKNLYTEVTRPIGGRFHFAGEATSIHHAWVVGALNSALRSVEEIVCVTLLSDNTALTCEQQLYCIGKGHLVPRLQEKWGGELYEISEGLVEKQVQLGRAQFDLDVGHPAPA